VIIVTTHFVDTEAIEQSSQWLTGHRSEIEHMVAQVRQRIETLMHEALQVPGVATELQSLHHEYERGCTQMAHGLEGLIHYLRQIIMQYNNMGMTGGGATHGPINTIPSGSTIPTTPSVPMMAGVPTTGVMPSGVTGTSLPMDSHGGMTVPVGGVMPSGVTGTSLPMDSHGGTTVPIPAVVTPTEARPHLA
jgi:hypothetical protein